MQNPELHNPHFDGEPFFLEGGKTGVFLSHGFTATCWEVRQLADALHQHGYTVAGPLLPGHGASPADLNRARWQEWAAAGEELYQRLTACCDSVFVGGESMGSLLALYLASQHPEIAGVLCYSPAVKLTLSQADKIKLRLAAPFMPQTGRASLDRSDVWQGYPGLPLKAAVQLLEFQKVVLGRLPHIQQPILALQGRLDTSVHPEAGSFLFSQVRSTIKEHHWMEKSTHVITLDVELEQVVQITIDFCEKFAQLD
jgi:carboxylesterase